MNESTSRKLARHFLTGASGAGKTTLALRLPELLIPGVESINCDRAKVEARESADPENCSQRYFDIGLGN